MSSLRPLHGVRFALVLDETAPDAAIYRGHAHYPDRDVPLRVRVSLPSGEVVASIDEAKMPSKPGILEPGACLKPAAALVRAATKAEAATGEGLPQKIVRWRGT